MFTSFRRFCPSWASRPIFLIILVGLTLRLGFMSINYPMMRWQNDQRFSIPVIHLIEGKGLTLVEELGPTAYRPPLYIFWLAMSYAIFGARSMLGPSFLQILVSTANIFLLYILARQLWKNEKIANASALLLAVHPYAVYHDSALYHTFLSTALLLGAFTLLFRGIERKRSSVLFASGLLFGGCVLILSVIVPFLMLLMASGLVLLKITMKKRVLLVTAFTAGLLLVWGPWIIRNAVTFREFVPLTTESGVTLWMGNNPHSAELMPVRGHEASPVPKGTRFNLPEFYEYCRDNPGWCEGGISEPEENRELTALAMGWIRANPVEFFRLTLWRFGGIWSPFLTPAKSFFDSALLTGFITYGYFAWNILLYALILFGTYLAWMANKKHETVILWILTLSSTGGYALFLYFTKYRIPFESCLIIFAGPGLVWLWKRLRKKPPVPQLEGHE
jgi:4-amino-4-deoxy-L-arabinose transferase-like glycosyltransferase